MNICKELALLPFDHNDWPCIDRAIDYIHNLETELRKLSKDKASNDADYLKQSVKLAKAIQALERYIYDGSIVGDVSYRVDKIAREALAELRK